MEIPQAGETELRGKFRAKHQKKWKQSLEEKLVRSLAAHGGLALKVTFSLGTEANLFEVIQGKGMLFKKIPTAGMFLGIIQSMTNQALMSIRSTDQKWSEGERPQVEVPTEL